MIRFGYGKKGRKHHPVKNKYTLVILLRSILITVLVVILIIWYGDQY